MDHLIRLLSSLGTDPETTRQTLILVMSCAIFVLGVAIYSVVAGLFDPMRQRVTRVVTGAPATAGGVFANKFVRAFEKAAPVIVPSNSRERSAADDRLLHAGYRASSRLAVYYGLRTLLIVVLPVLVLALSPMLFATLAAKKVLMTAAGFGVFGMIAPSYTLDKQVANRQREIANAFPDVLDLLVVCTEAGLGLNAALQRVAQEIGPSHPILGEELNLVNAEIRAGVDRVEALRNLAKRTGMEDIRGLVALLAQSLSFGTSVADALRVYADEFRDKRMQRAEEEAAKLGTKMIFPLVFCFFPGFFAIAMGPAVLKAIAVFAGLKH